MNAMQHDTEQISIPPDGRPEHEQPRWRQDFPIDWPQDEFVARRDFTKFLILTSLAFTVGQFWIIAQNFFRVRKGEPRIMEIAGADELQVGGSLTFDYPGAHDNCILVRTGRETYVAYSQKCTHLSCPVRPDVAKGALHCPCHEGSFDMNTGRPTGGPPRRPLPVVELGMRGGRLCATGIRERMV